MTGPVLSPMIARRPGCVVLTPHGVLDHSAAAKLREMLFDPTVCDQPAIVIDLDEVTHLESTAIGALVAARRWHQARSTTMQLVVRAGSAAYDVFTTAPFAAIFDVLDSWDDGRPGVAEAEPWTGRPT